MLSNRSFRCRDRTPPRLRILRSVASRLDRAFARVDVVVLVGVLWMVAATAFPGWVNQRRRSDQTACFNNLRQIGEAFHSYATDHVGETPWMQEYRRTPPALLADARFEFSLLSNHLSSVRLLLCPSDSASRNSEEKERRTGLTEPRAVDYFIGTHASASRPIAILSGDRNLRYDGEGNCVLGLSKIWMFEGGGSQGAWTNAIHGLTGNLLFGDGQVQQTTTAGLRCALAKPVEQGLTHIIAPAPSP
jgi:Tfp pilus assembly protein PilE